MEVKHCEQEWAGWYKKMTWCRREVECVTQHPYAPAPVIEMCRLCLSVKCDYRVSDYKDKDDHRCIMERRSNYLKEKRHGGKTL